MGTGRPTPPGGDGVPVDLAAALRQVAGDRELLVELVQTFCEDTPGRMRGLGEAIQLGDAAAAARAVHTMRGSLGILGARHAGELARQLEAVADAGDLARARGLLALFTDEISRIIGFLSDLSWQDRV